MYENSKMQPMSKNMGRVAKRERKELFMSKVSDAAFKVVASATTTAIIGIELVKYTLEQRGYFAIGGEWMAMAFIFYGIYSLLSVKKANQKRWSARRKAIIPSCENKINRGGK